MELSELKIRLKLASDDTSQDEYLQVQLDDAIDIIKEYCGDDFVDGLPGGVKKAIALLVKSAGENNTIASQSLDGMSKSFFQGATKQEAFDFLAPYVKKKKVRFL